MVKKTFDYLEKIKALKKHQKALSEEVNMTTVKFSVESVLSILLIEAREKLWREEEVRKIYSDVKGIGWNTKLTSRFKAYELCKRVPCDIFLKLCTYLKKNQNRLLNQGECALVATYIDQVYFDPYGITPHEAHQKTEVIE